MSRIWTMSHFLVRDLFQSLAGVVPLAACLAFGLIAFGYGMGQSQFIVVAGVGIGVIGFLTTSLLAGRANRAASYLFIVRLHHRSELLSAIWLGGLGLTWLWAALIAFANLLAGHLTLSWPSLLWILPTWLVLWLLIVALAVLLSDLVSRDGSSLVGYVLLVAMLVVNDQRQMFLNRGLEWPVVLVGRVLWPVSTLLSRASVGIRDRTYYLAMALTLGYALSAFVLAAALFSDKDLLGAE